MAGDEVRRELTKLFFYHHKLRVPPRMKKAVEENNGEAVILVKKPSGEIVKCRLDRFSRAQVPCDVVREVEERGLTHVRICLVNNIVNVEFYKPEDL